MADKKRFVDSKKNFSLPILTFKNKLKFEIIKKVSEKKITQYIISNIEGYKKIIDKIKIKQKINIFSAKRVPFTSLSKIVFFKDFPNSANLKNKKISSFQGLIQTKNIILTTNPRLDSPAFNAYLFQNFEEFNLISLSTFSSNFVKKEIPLSKFLLIQFLKGLFDTQDTTFIESPLNMFPLTKFAHVSLIPLYMHNLSNQFQIEKQKETEILLSKKKIKSLGPLFYLWQKQV